MPMKGQFCDRGGTEKPRQWAGLLSFEIRTFRAAFTDPSGDRGWTTLTGSSIVAADDPLGRLPASLVGLRGSRDVTRNATTFAAA